MLAPLFSRTPSELSQLGYFVRSSLEDIDDPVLCGPDGEPVDAWRSGYPYEELLDRQTYEESKRALQIELLKAQRWIDETGQRVVVIFEGRDAAGKGGTIKRFMEHLNPRGARVVALPPPSALESGQWYFQRYVAQLPTRGEMVLFDRSWYNRAVVEKVMGFCTPDETEEFLLQVPNLEDMFVRSGIHLVKLWFSVSREEQLARFASRGIDPVRVWKLSPTDVASIDRWDDYTRAKEEMFRRTHTTHAPWMVVQSNDKKRGRLEAMRHVLAELDYPEKDPEALISMAPLIIGPPPPLSQASE